MKTLKIISLFACIILVIGCLDSTGPEVITITEPSGTTHYYINNQSGVNLDAAYTRLGSQADSLKTIPADTSIRILEHGSFGNNPSPSTSFSKIVFYEGTPDTSKPALIIDPVEDDAWDIIAEEGFEDSELGFRAYELVITDEDLN